MVEMTLRVQLGRALDRRVEEDDELVVLRGDDVGDVPAPGPEHVVHGTERLAVEADVGDRVEPFEDEDAAQLAEPDFGEGDLVEGEGPPVLPVRLRDPLHPKLVVDEERVGD